MVLLHKSVGTPTQTSGNLMDLDIELKKHAKSKGLRYLHYVNFLGQTLLDAHFKIVGVTRNKTRVLAYTYTLGTVLSSDEDTMFPIMEYIKPNEEIQIFCIEDAGGATEIQLCIRNIPKRRRRR